MKKTLKLAIKKVTLRDLDEPKLEDVAGGLTASCATLCGGTCPVRFCETRDGQASCLVACL
jgi:hypothetical protein